MWHFIYHHWLHYPHPHPYHYHYYHHLPHQHHHHHIIIAIIIAIMIVTLSYNYHYTIPDQYDYLTTPLKNITIINIINSIITINIIIFFTIMLFIIALSSPSSSSLLLSQYCRFCRTFLYPFELSKGKQFIVILFRREMKHGEAIGILSLRHKCNHRFLT